MIAISGNYLLEDPYFFDDWTIERLTTYKTYELQSYLEELKECGITNTKLIDAIIDELQSRNEPLENKPSFLAIGFHAKSTTVILKRCGDTRFECYKFNKDEKTKCYKLHSKEVINDKENGNEIVLVAFNIAVKENLHIVSRISEPNALRFLEENL